jgi:anti-sigma-K factor RskA
VASWVLLSVGSAAAATAVVLYALGFIRTNRGQEPQVALLPSPTGVGIAARW